MNFDKALGIPKELPFTEGGHSKKYQMIIEALGYENVKRCIPFTIKELRKAYGTNEHFNNLPLRRWDAAAGFSTHGANCTFVGSGLTRLYREKCNVDTFSCSDGVCILKECARMWVEEGVMKDGNEQ